MLSARSGSPSTPGLPASSTLQQRNALRAGEVTAVELVQHTLDAAARQEALGAFVSVNAELALKEAATIDARFAATLHSERSALPSLLGVPTAHKDLLAVRGTTSRHGSATIIPATASTDDPTAAAVRTAGAISVGKTQVPEFGIAGYSENEIAAPARNPHDPARTAGGSSGGTAAAIAAGIITGAIGSDAGGSIRIPSSACGLVGLKPGRGAVPADTPSGAELAQLRDLGLNQLGVSGPMASTVSDAALWFDALCDETNEPHLRAVEHIRSAPDSLRGLRIGISLASPFAEWTDIAFDSAALSTLRHAGNALSEAGHEVGDASFNYHPNYAEAFTTVWTSSLGRIPFAPGTEQHLSALAAMFLRRARRTSRLELLTAASELREFASTAVAQWAEFDAVLTPALAFTTPPVGAFRELQPEDDYRLQCQWAPQTSMVNVAGVPAITVPSGIDHHGLPRGVQLIGRHGSESVLLQLAAQLSVLA